MQIWSANHYHYVPNFSDSDGGRTHDSYIKSVVLCHLSYEVIPLWFHPDSNWDDLIKSQGVLPLTYGIIVVD